MKVPGAEAFFFPPKETGKGVRWGDGRDGGVGRVGGRMRGGG